MSGVSIAIAAFDPVKEWLQHAIESCAGVDEIIVCNDGSAAFDESQYRAPPGARLRIVHNERTLGGFKAYNVAVAHCTGAWISTPGDDDCFDAAALPVLLERLAVTRADIVYYPYQTFGEVQAVRGRHPRITYRSLRRRNRIYGASFFRREVWDFLEGYQLDVAADWDFWLRAYKSGFRFEYFPLVVGRYRVTARSMFEKQRKELGKEALKDVVRAHAALWKKKRRRGGSALLAALRALFGLSRS